MPIANELIKTVKIKLFIYLFNLADDEIAKAITQNTVNIAVINTYFDFNDYNNPVKYFSKTTLRYHLFRIFISTLSTR